ncbi:MULTISPECIES: response regulator [Tsukamurella]|uniref:Response regulator n=1 Tax=Tsukamurella spumae TaxID=44753 RepID=A0A846WWP9_9ACTN|nr:response regulator [Tsukamurella spumae]NKY17331.1 response regulator [Tsukamurella spumae]
MTGAAPLVLVYSSNARHRAEITAALGTRPAPDRPPITVLEAATAQAVIARLDEGGVALAVLDGESSPAGGMGLARQVRDEIDPCPPLLVITARRADGWLARWSQADDWVSHPLDPFELAEAAGRLLATATL